MILPMTQTAAQPSNRRVMRRIACRIRGHLLCDTGLRLSCETSDISESGVRVILPTRLRETQGHMIEAIALRGIPPLAVQLRWARDRDAGLAFTGRPDQRDLVRALLDHLEKARAEALNRPAQTGQVQRSRPS